MPSNPTDAAQIGHRMGLYLNSGGSYENWIDRLQSLTPNFNARTETYYELGNIDPVGSGQDPTEHTLAWNQNMVSTEADLILANKNPSTAGSFTMGDILNNAGLCNGYVVMRANGATNPNRELALTGLTVEELMYRFEVRQPSVFSARLRGTTGKWYTSGSLVHASWGTYDTTSAGAIRGRDARIFFTGSAAGNRVYRLQRVEIRAQFPAQYIEELGNRSIVGTIADNPDVFMDFDLLNTDDQPHDVWATLTSGYYDFQNLTQNIAAHVRLYDPASAEGSSVVRAWSLENLMAISGDPVQANVRGLLTTRYSVRVGKTTTLGSGGLKCFVGDIV